MEQQRRQATRASQLLGQPALATADSPTPRQTPDLLSTLVLPRSSSDSAWMQAATAELQGDKDSGGSRGGVEEEGRDEDTSAEAAQPKRRRISSGHPQHINGGRPPDNELWERRFAELQSYFHQHANSDVPCRYVDQELGRWVKNQRASYRRGILSEDRIKKLETVDFNWVIRHRAKEKGSKSLLSTVQSSLTTLPSNATSAPVHVSLNPPSTLSASNPVLETKGGVRPEPFAVPHRPPPTVVVSEVKLDSTMELNLPDASIPSDPELPSGLDMRSLDSNSLMIEARHLSRIQSPRLSSEDHLRSQTQFDTYLQLGEFLGRK